jgi:ring-1,2-phenylacetyl-CoA epoxidase subunit PaaA
MNPSKLSNAEREKRMQEKINNHEMIESCDDMSDEYYELLTNLMLQQADSELAGAFGYVPWIMKAPTTEEMLVVSNITRDEVRHARAMFRLLEELNIPVEDHVHEQDFTFRLENADANIGAQRAAKDSRVNIFYYPINSWADFCMFNFCMDRGAGHQLEDVKESTYGPWQREIGRIFREEMTHVGHGDYWVKKLALENPETKAEIQKALDLWFPRTMNIFGKPRTAKNDLYRKYGIKRRTNEEVRDAFAAEIKKNCDEWGLKVPEWIPDWATIPEDAVIVG